MTEANSSTTVQIAQSKTTQNYSVYDSPEGDLLPRPEIVGTYISQGVAEDLGEYIELSLSKTGEDGLEVSLDRDSGNYGVYSSEADAIETMYVAHELLDTLGDESDDEENLPQSLRVVARESTEEAFEHAVEAVTPSEEQVAEEEDALVAGDADSSPDDSQAEEESEDEVTISDEEIGLVEADE